MRKYLKTGTEIECELTNEACWNIQTNLHKKLCLCVDEMFKRVTENDKEKTKQLKYCIYEGVAFRDENTIRREI